MQLAKWGNSFAVRVQYDGSLRIARKMTSEEALMGLRKYRGRMPADFKFDREEANAR